jgi:hypothetical protein
MSTIQVETIDPAVAAVDEKVSAANLNEDKPIAASSVSVVVDNEAPGWTVVEKTDVDAVAPVAAEVMEVVVGGGGGMTTTSGDVPFDEEKMDAIEKNAPSTMEVRHCCRLLFN